MQKTDAETVKKTLMYFTKALRQMEREVLIQGYVLNILRQALGIGSEIDRMLKDPKALDVIERQLQETYDKPMEKMFAAIDSAELDTQLSDLLAKLEVKGPPS